MHVYGHLSLYIGDTNTDGQYITLMSSDEDEGEL